MTSTGNHTCRRPFMVCLAVVLQAGGRLAVQGRCRAPVSDFRADGTVEVRDKAGRVSTMVVPPVLLPALAA